MADNTHNEPAAEAVSLIKAGDIQVCTWTARPTGFARLVPNGIRILHSPTGLVVECEDDRSQHRNRQIALERLEAKLKELGWTPGAVADEPQDLTSRLSRALADELRRRRVTSLALKGELMRDLGLDTLEQADAWIAQASLTFAAVAEEFIASQPAARVEDGVWRPSVERLVRAKDRVDETRLAIQGEDADTSPAAEQRHTAALILLEGEFRRARELVAPLPCSVVDSDVDEGAGLADSQPLNVNLHALAKNPAAALRAFGPEWAGRCAVSALQALAAHEVLTPLNPVDLRGVDVGSPADWSQIPGAQAAQLVQVADVPRLVARLLGTRRYASQDLMSYPHHQVESRYEASGRPGVTMSLDLRARNVGPEAQIEISITDHYSRSNRSSTSHFGLQLPTAAARALALSICPDLAVDHVAASYREEPSSGA